MILVGDVGGTKTDLAVFEPSAERSEPVVSATLPSAEHDGLESALDAFLKLHPINVQAAVFGVAGPVVHSASGAFWPERWAAPPARRWALS